MVCFQLQREDASIFALRVDDDEAVVRRELRGKRLVQATLGERGLPKQMNRIKAISVNVTLPPSPRVLRLDLFRGLANWTIFLDGLEQELKFFNWLEGDVCMTCTAGDPEKSIDGSFERPGLDAI